VKEKILAAGPDVLNTVGPLFTELDTWLARLTKLLLWPGTKVITAKLVYADSKLDHSLSAFGASLRNIIRYSTDSVLPGTANRVLAMLKQYGRVAVKAYDTQSGVLTIILENLNGEFAADITALGIGTLRDALQAAFDNFKAVMAEREAIDKSRPRDPDGKVDTSEKIRKGLEGVYRKIATVINAGAAIGLSTEFDEFIAGLNPVIERFNREYQPGRRDISRAKLESIPDEPWTGKERTPVVNVSYDNPDGTVDILVLGQHYNVTYRNNIEPGNAECTIHGKGRYKGSKTVSFIIRHGVTNAEWNAEIEEAAAKKAEEAKKKKAKKAAKTAVVAPVAPVAPKAEEAPVEEKKPVAKAVKAPKGDKEKATKAAKKAKDADK
jgi:hypothetical protein